MIGHGGRGDGGGDGGGGQPSLVFSQGGGGGGGGQCFWGIRRLSSLSHIWMQGKGRTASMVSARMFWVFSPAAQLAKAQQITESRIQVPIGRVKMAGWSK